ncbi:MAG: hypothetical protein KDI09_14645 [Halioglobus sp.]|nr:hypothetical protein [Halioglobus sp.]
MLANGQTLETALQKLLNLLYESAVEDSAFSEFIKTLAVASNSHFAGLEIVDRQAANRCQWQENAAFGLPLDIVTELNATFLAHNPFVNLVADTATEGSTFVDSDVISRRHLKATLYYNEFMRHYDFEHVSGMYVLHNSDVSVIASTSKGRLAGPFTTEEKTLFSLIIPHMQTFLGIKQRIGQLSIDRDIGWELLNQLNYGAVVIDRQAKIVRANPAAEAITRAEDGLSIVRGRLHAANSGARQALRTAINRAIAAYTAVHTFSSRENVPIPRRSGKRPYQVEIMPLRHPQQLYVAAMPAALVFIHDAHRGHRLEVNSVMQMYGLTETEAQVATQLAAGKSPEEIASAQAHSLATTRTLIKRVLFKTDTHRQSELVSLLLRGLDDDAGRLS